MAYLDNKKVIFWDFDGVIMDSMPVRSAGFREVLKNYPEEEINSLIAYHELNGGLSRYVKFKYFFEVLRNERITVEQLQDLVSEFKEIMLGKLHNKDLLIQDSLQFIIDQQKRFTMHIVSGSDGVELNQLCKLLQIDHFFKTINGSPTPKQDLVRQLIEKFDLAQKDCVLIGDSINDREAAMENHIDFIGYNNESFKHTGPYISSFSGHPSL